MKTIPTLLIALIFTQTHLISVATGDHVVIEIAPITETIPSDSVTCLNDLPTEIFLDIVETLGPDERANLKLTCRAFLQSIKCAAVAGGGDQFVQKCLLNATEAIKHGKITNKDGARISVRKKFDNVIKTILEVARVVADMELAVFQMIMGRPIGDYAGFSFKTRFESDIREGLPARMRPLIRSYDELNAYRANVFYPAAIGQNLPIRAQKIVKAARRLLRRRQDVYKLFLKSQEYQIFFTEAVVRAIFGSLPLDQRLEKLVSLNLERKRQDKRTSKLLRKYSKLYIGKSGLFIGSYLQSAEYPAANDNDPTFVHEGRVLRLKFFEDRNPAKIILYEEAPEPLPEPRRAPAVLPFPRMNLLLKARQTHMETILQNPNFKLRNSWIYNLLQVRNACDDLVGFKDEVRISAETSSNRQPRINSSPASLLVFALMVALMVLETLVLVLFFPAIFPLVMLYMAFRKISKCMPCCCSGDSGAYHRCEGALLDDPALDFGGIFRT